MQVRRDFLAVRLPLDCRCLLEFVEDAEEMAKPLGFSGAEDFIRRGLELDLQQVAWAVEGLKQLKPNEPVPYARAQELGKREIGAGKAGPGRGHKTGSNAARFVGGAPYILARLDRDGLTELAAQVRAGTISANAAAIKAGFRKRRRCPHCEHEL
jgi:hypothetical protein